MTRLRGFFLVSSTLAAVAGTLVACSSSDEDRLPFNPDDTTTDGGGTSPEASLPPPSSQDAGDAGKADVVTPPIVRPPFDAADVPVTCATEPCAVQLVAGDQHFCARLSDGTVRCWGNNSAGQLGNGQTVDTNSSPQAVVNITTATQISAAEYATCAVLADNTTRCWGGNRQGQLGLRAAPGLTDYVAHPTPAPVVTTNLMTRVDVGPRTVCALTTTDGANCWGYNDQQQLTRADAGTTGGPGPANISTFKLTRIASTQTSVFALTDDGHVVQWGKTSGRESSITPTTVASTIGALEKVTSIAAGSAHACAIADGELYCWGTGSKGALGTGLPNEEKLPAHAPIVNSDKLEFFPQQVAASANVTCVRITNGTVQCTGDDSYGALAVPGDVPASSPFLTKISAYTGDAVQVAVSGYSVCALDKAGKVQCWGGNIYGELGQGIKDFDRHTTPVAVTF